MSLSDNYYSPAECQYSEAEWSNSVANFNHFERFAEAIQVGSRAIQRFPNSFTIHFNTANAARKLGKSSFARLLYKRSIYLMPSDPMAWNNLGLTLLGDGDLNSAKEAFKKSIDLSHAEKIQPLVNFAMVCRQLGELSEALEATNKAIAIDGGSMEAYANRSAIYHEMNFLAPALSDIERAIQLKPNQPSLYYNAGNIHVSSRDWGAAITSFDRSLSINSGLTDAKLNRSICILMQKQWEKGFQSYESRWNLFGKSSPFESQKSLDQARERILSSTKLELYAEQGLGDSIQFARYLSLLNRSVTTIRLHVQKSLIQLFQDNLIADDVIQVTGASHLKYPDFQFEHYKFPLISLPLLLQVYPDSKLFPVDPYLKSNDSDIKQWSRRLADANRDSDRLRVGICWAGNPKQGTDKKRSLSLGKVARLFSVPCRWINLKVDLSEESRLRLQNHCVEDYSSYVEDMKDTAALVANLDLVISTCTSVAHLSGALGIPTWILLAYSPDWRWGDNGESSIWYPSARLFRQTIPGDWDGLLDNVDQALMDEIDSFRSKRRRIMR